MWVVLIRAPCGVGRGYVCRLRVESAVRPCVRHTRKEHHAMKIGNDCNDSLNAQVQAQAQVPNGQPTPRAVPAQERLELNLANLSYKALKTRL